MKTILLASLFVFGLPLHAEPQSEGASQLSAISLAPSVELTSSVLRSVPAGSRLIVKAFRPVGELVEIVAISAVTGVSITLMVGKEALKLSGLVVGGALVLTVVSAGFILMAGSEALAFIPNEICQPHIHHRRLSS